METLILPCRHEINRDIVRTAAINGTLTVLLGPRCDVRRQACNPITFCGDSAVTEEGNVIVSSLLMLGVQVKTVSIDGLGREQNMALRGNQHWYCSEWQWAGKVSIN